MLYRLIGRSQQRVRAGMSHVTAELEHTQHSNGLAYIPVLGEFLGAFKKRVNVDMHSQTTLK